MDRLQPPVERVGVWRGEGSEDHAEQTVEAGRSHVQQVNTSSCFSPSSSFPPPLVFYCGKSRGGRKLTRQYCPSLAL